MLSGVGIWETPGKVQNCFLSIKKKQTMIAKVISKFRFFPKSFLWLISVLELKFTWKQPRPTPPHNSSPLFQN